MNDGIGNFGTFFLGFFFPPFFYFFRVFTLVSHLCFIRGRKAGFGSLLAKGAEGMDLFMSSDAG